MNFNVKRNFESSNGIQTQRVTCFAAIILPAINISAAYTKVSSIIINERFYKAIKYMAIVDISLRMISFHHFLSLRDKV